MKREPLLLLACLVMSTVVVIGSCARDPDWEFLYSEKLGHPIVDLDDTYLDRDYSDPVESGSLTRAAWVRLSGGEIVLLGLPPHGFEPAEIVERTVLLRPEEWRSACAEALGQPDAEGWRMPHAHRGSSIRIYAGNRHDAYCEFFYLPEGWELRTVYSQGVVKPRVIAAPD